MAVVSLHLRKVYLHLDFLCKVISAIKESSNQRFKNNDGVLQREGSDK